MACPFRKETCRKAPTARELPRLPPRPVPGCQPVPRHYPLYRQATFPNIVHTVYAAILREINTKGEDSRFEKVERGRFALSLKH